LARLGTAGPGMFRSGRAWIGAAGAVWCGRARSGAARPGAA